MKTEVVCGGIVCLFAAQSQGSTIYTYNGSTGLTVHTSAVAGTTDLELTSANTDEAGLAYTTSPLVFGAGDVFTTTFDFQITPGTNPPGEGFAFLLSDAPLTLGAAGEGLGYSRYGSAINTQSLAIAFDTYNYGTADNDSSNNVTMFGDGVITSYLNSTNVYGNGSCTSGAGCMSNGQLWSATITYDGTDLGVTLDDPEEAQSFTFSEKITLSTYLGTSNNVYVGFSGGTGSQDQEQDITDWQVADTTTVPEPASLGFVAAGLLLLGLHRNVGARGK